MMNDLQIFENEQFGKIRTVMIDGEPWFVLRDVCNALGIAQTRDAANRLDEDDKGLTMVIDKMGRNQKMTIINESGLYNVIFRSEKPEAKTFKRWVTHDVLPTLRKTGTYTTAAALPKAGPTVPLGALVRLMELQRAVMQDMNCTPHEIAGMVTGLSRAYNVAVPVAMSAKVPDQLSLFDVPGTIPQLPTTAIS